MRVAEAAHVVRLERRLEVGPLQEQVRVTQRVPLRESRSPTSPAPRSASIMTIPGIRSNPLSLVGGVLTRAHEDTLEGFLGWKLRGARRRPSAFSAVFDTCSRSACAASSTTPAGEHSAPCAPAFARLEDGRGYVEAGDERRPAEIVGPEPGSTAGTSEAPGVGELNGADDASRLVRMIGRSSARFYLGETRWGSRRARRRRSPSSGRGRRLRSLRHSEVDEGRTQVEAAPCGDDGVLVLGDGLVDRSVRQRRVLGDRDLVAEAADRDEPRWSLVLVPSGSAGRSRPERVGQRRPRSPKPPSASASATADLPDAVGPKDRDHFTDFVLFLRGTPSHDPPPA